MLFCCSDWAYGQYGSALLYDPQCTALRAARRHESERLMTFCQGFGQYGAYEEPAAAPEGGQEWEYLGAMLPCREGAAVHIPAGGWAVGAV